MASIPFRIDAFSLGDLEITDYEAVALDLENIHEMYAKLGLPQIDGIIGGDLLKRYKAVINYKLKKMRLSFSKPRLSKTAQHSINQ